jgi:beta-N-acetylhexosaminidase
MKPINELTKQVGQLFIIGFPEEVPSAIFLNFVKEEGIGGVILFEDNFPTHLQARENIARIKALFRSAPPFIAVDQEGGRVCRLHGSPAEFSSAAEYGRRNDIERFREEYYRSAVYMESLGINLNLAPVADIQLEKENSCLDGRCFGESPEIVAEFVRASVEVSRSADLLSCLKHFPGMGAAVVDPHKGTAEVDCDSIIWKQREKLPFEVGAKAGADLLMTTHMVMTGFDRTIATGSRKIIDELARSELFFDGPIVTDDLLMEGASSLGNYGERAVAAFNAGHDLLLFGQNCEASMQAYDYFVDACHRGEVDAKRLEVALDRVAGVKYKLGRSVVG